MVLDRDGLRAHDQDDSRGIPAKPGWRDLRIQIDVESCKYTVTVDGETALPDIDFADNVDSVKRLEFRTGSFRMADPRFFDQHREPPKEKLDLDGADIPLPESVLSIGSVTTE